MRKGGVREREREGWRKCEQKKGDHDIEKREKRKREEESLFKKKRGKQGMPLHQKENQQNFV
jgi:hypothetical protein